MTFTEDDVLQWKNNIVTKAFAKALMVNIEDTSLSICNIDSSNLLDFGRLQGKRFALIDLLQDVLNPSYSDLKEFIQSGKKCEELKDG